MKNEKKRDCVGRSVLWHHRNVQFAQDEPCSPTWSPFIISNACDAIWKQSPENQNSETG